MPIQLVQLICLVHCSLLLTLSVLSWARHVCPEPSLLVPQVEDGGPQPQLGDLAPYELPVLRVDDAQPHEAVLVHSHQTAPSHLLLQETLGVEMIVITTVAPQPLLNVNHRPDENYILIIIISISSHHCCTDFGLWVLTALGCCGGLTSFTVILFSENIIRSLTKKIYFLDQKIDSLRHNWYHWTKLHWSLPWFDISSSSFSSCLTSQLVFPSPSISNRRRFCCKVSRIFLRN